MSSLNLKTNKILLTGGHGFLGTKVYNELLKQGATRKNIYRPTMKELDLRVAENAKRAVKNQDLVIHLAANVGGIGYNQTNPGQIFYDNAIMGINLIEAARLAEVKKFVQVGTVCAYPKFAPVPFKEKDLWLGYPEETNAPYGLSKKMLLVQLQAYRQEYDFNGIYVIPVNLYGPGDNFKEQSSHVIPALIKKFVEAKEAGKKEVEVWGTGKASREFLYVEDAARGIVLAALKYDKPEPVNLGSANEIKIKELAPLIAKLTGFTGKIVWDKTKPDGQPRRKLDVTRAKKEFGFVSKVNFEMGLKKTIEWYENRKID
ncbi:MAG: GDP-L-fucose synthase [Candidatus Doudnabacteria bacterium]|nr:GDP-L-fucose synthase [Candidatus Doudnabacteria bacterium]